MNGYKKYFNTKFKRWQIVFNLHKSFFDKGWGLTSYLKYLFAIIGLGSMLTGISIFTVLIVGVFYGIGCYVLGRWWKVSGMEAAEIEISNRFNLFVKEMRKTYNNRKV